MGFAISVFQRFTYVNEWIESIRLKVSQLVRWRSYFLFIVCSQSSWSFVSLIGCSLVTGYFSILTTLNIEVTHRRIKRKYWKISLAVQHQVAPHGVENCPILKYFQRNFSGVDCLNTNNKNKVEKSIEWKLIFPIWLTIREPSSIKE